MHPKDADGMENNVDPNQPIPSEGLSGNMEWKNLK